MWVNTEVVLILQANRVSSCHDDIVDLEDHTHAFCCQGEGTGGDEGGLDNFSGFHVHDSTLTDV